MQRHNNEDSWSNKSLMEYIPAGKDVRTEDEGTPSLGSVIRQRLMEIVTDREYWCVCVTREQ
jgi:hypothetical protein